MDYLKILSVFLLFSLLQTKLYQVFSVARHGSRYHVYDYANSSQTFALLGELSSTGMRQHQKFGQIIRKQYIENLGFLNPNYNQSQIQIYSTPVNRTVNSIRSFLSGLYPLGTGPKMSFVDKQWHLPPYSNKTDISEQNYALPSGHQIIKVYFNQKIATSDCPKYSDYLQKNQQIMTDDIREIMTTYKPFYKRLGQMYNFSTDQMDIKTFLNIYDVANVDKYLGRPWPQNMTQSDFSNLQHLANWYYYMAMGGDNTPMSVSGKFQRMFSVFDTRQRIPDSYSLKWTFLSGHDTDIMALHLAMNLSSCLCVEELYRKGETSALNCETGGNRFASNLIFQLHSDDGIFFYVKVRSNGKYVKLCGKNSESCDYFTFKNSVKKFIVSNLETICGKPLDTKPETSRQEYMIF